MATSGATTETKSKFGVPTGTGASGILMPKLKYRFRVSFLNNFGGSVNTVSLTQNVQSVEDLKLTMKK